MFQFRALFAAASMLAASVAVVDVAQAACTRLAFSVNDYGKDGPTRDARNLLDKYIAKWAADRKIKVGSVGPKEVTCELFLDVILFDEYTCRAAATVCWNGPLPAGHQVEADANAPVLNKAKAKADAPKAGPGTVTAKQGPTPISTGSVKAAPAAARAPAPAAPAAKAPAPAPAAPAAN